MINFEKHIQNLLFEYDFFIVPGFGAFIARFTQPAIDEENGNLIEPIKHFDFNSALDEDEANKFLNHVMRIENKPLAESELQLKEFIYKLKKELKEGKIHEMAGIGNFSMKNDLLIGDLNEQMNYFHNAEFDSKISTFSSGGLEKTNDFFEPDLEEDIEEENEKKSNLLKYILYFLPVLILLAALYYTLIYLPDSKNTKTELAIEKTDLEKVDSLQAPKDILQLKAIDSLRIDSVIKDIPAENKITSELKSEDVKILSNKINSEIYRFNVWAGLFRQKSNANKVTNLLKDNGLNAKIEIVGKNRRVYVPVKTEADAQEMVKKIEQLTGEKAVYFEK